MSEQFDAMRAAMVASQLRTVAVDDPRVLAAMASVPRERFVPTESRALAYADAAVPLGGGRFLNTPLATARLFTAAAIEPLDRVLVVGAASGYSLAIALQMSNDVTGLECDPALAVLARAYVDGATIVEGPLAGGVPDAPPFDVIIIDGAVAHLPDGLVAQLSPHGRLAAGIVDRGVTRLSVGRRGGTGFAMTALLDAGAVPLPGFAPAPVFVF